MSLLIIWCQSKWQESAIMEDRKAPYHNVGEIWITQSGKVSIWNQPITFLHDNFPFLIQLICQISIDIGL